MRILPFHIRRSQRRKYFQILSDLTKDLEDKDYYLTVSRKEAIALAAKIAQENDLVLITGKGNETVENVCNYLFKHNDFALIKEALNRKESL